MAIDDTFAGTYFLGTADEIDGFRTKQPGSHKQFNAALVATGVIGLLAIPYSLPLAADVLCRLGYSYFAKGYDPQGAMQRMSHSPGIVGLVRQAFER